MKQPRVLKPKWSKPHFNASISKTMGKWSDVSLGSTSWRLWGKLCSHSFEYKNLSNILQIGTSCMFDQVKDAFLSGELINSLSFINSSKTFMLRVNLEPPNYFEILLMTLIPLSQHAIFFFFIISKANCIKTEARSYKAYRKYTKQLAPLKAKRRPTEPHHPLIGR